MKAPATPTIFELRAPMKKVPSVTVAPLNSLNLLSEAEVEAFTHSDRQLFSMFRHCALAILNTDSEKDNAQEVFDDFADFDIRLVPQPRGLKLELSQAPSRSFVDGKMIRGIQEHLFSALRDIVYTDFKITAKQSEEPTSADITNMVFRILRNADAVRPGLETNMVVCWGGHSIPRTEYDYAKEVGYELGLRGLNIVTGCGIGAMKAPMKGAAVGHAKQQVNDGRYVGITEPGIIASESPNAIVNELVIMPDIEKRLEAFVRLAHTIIVFPGGVGTVEEILYLLGILMHPDNSGQLPLVLAGPSECTDYFDELESFLESCLGPEVRNHYHLILGSPEEVGRYVRVATEQVHVQRTEQRQAYYFNWALHIQRNLQDPFLPTHEAMAKLKLDGDQPKHELASELRRAFSGIVAGNVKPFGIAQVRDHGPFKLTGDPGYLEKMDSLLHMMVREQRMKLGEHEDDYQPCYQLV